MTEESSSLNIPLAEKLKSIPGIFGIRLGEEPLYDILRSEGNIEIRKYPAVILASVTINGNFENATEEAFLALANYIFGQNKDKKNLKMTSPVFQEENHEYIPMTSPVLQKATNSGWTMSFVLPAKYSLASAPTPQDKRIHLHKKPERLVATLRYSGSNDQEKIKYYSEELMNWVNEHFQYTPIGEIQSAQYDSPLTISFFRKNEIHIEINSLQ